MKCELIRWVAPTGSDPSVGGGVAKAVMLFKESAIVSHPAYLSLFSKSMVSQFIIAIRDAYFDGYRKYVIHSFFTPYFLFILLLPFEGSVILLPHGELKADALRLSATRKIIYLSLVSLVRRVFVFRKKVYVIASNCEEIRKARRVLSTDEFFETRDLVTQSISLQERKNVSAELGFNLVVISRLVPSKGVSVFLKNFIELVRAGHAGRIQGIHIFAQPEDLDETELVQLFLNKLEALGVNVSYSEGLSSQGLKDAVALLPNKVAFLPSRFESFGYVLLECLCFEYRPIVWFDNELVHELESNGLCEKIEFGTFPISNADLEMHEQDIDKALSFLDQMSAASKEAYKHYLGTIFSISS